MINRLTMNEDDEEDHEADANPPLFQFKYHFIFFFLFFTFASLSHAFEIAINSRFYFGLIIFVELQNSQNQMTKFRHPLVLR